MKCAACGSPIILAPSATERAARYGGKASDYSKLFTTCTPCHIKSWYPTRTRVEVRELPPIMQNLEMLRMRQRVCKAYGAEGGSREVAERVNGMTEEELALWL